MNDTTPEFEKRVRERFLAFAPAERVSLCADMFETARALVEASLPIPAGRSPSWPSRSTPSTERRSSASAGSFPATFNPVLGPHQTTGLELEDLFGNSQPPNNFVQTVVSWEADRGRGGLDRLDVVAARITRARNAANGNQGETLASAIIRCRELRSER